MVAGLVLCYMLFCFKTNLTTYHLSYSHRFLINILVLSSLIYCSLTITPNYSLVKFKHDQDAIHSQTLSTQQYKWLLGKM